MTCGVEINIRVSAEILWNLLTDAKGFSRWNSTVTGIEGQIREGERLRLHVPGTNRIFTPKVSGVVPARRMVWSDGFTPIFKGVRTFVLKPRNSESTDFVMEERFSGIMFALAKGMLPDYVVEKFCDGKYTAEIIEVKDEQSQLRILMTVI